MNKKVYLRAEGNNQIGLGHVFRLIALAERLVSHFNVCFLISAPSDSVAQLIKNLGVDLIDISECSLENESEYLIEKVIHQGDILVLDGYDYSTEYQRVYVAAGIKVVYIDDLCAQHMVAHLVINHAPSADKNKYSIEPYTNVCVGTGYALIRNQFLKAKNTYSASITSGQLVICFGGADPDNLTLRYAKLAIQLRSITSVVVVLGAAYRHLNEFEKYVATESKPIEIATGLSASEMIDVFHQSSFIICPSSTIAFEALTIGMRVCTGYFVENQREFSTYLHNHNFGVSVGDFNAISDAEILEKLEIYTNQIDTYTNQSFIVGDPFKNIQDVFLELSIC